MEALIQDRLAALQSQHKIRILYACESGSRAWGFPSPDSDYDVRFIYAHDLNWYLSLKARKDTLDLPISEQLDMGGWEICKTLNLLKRSNVPLLEWVQSPVVYTATEPFLSGLQELCVDNFSPVAAMHHYLSMSQRYLQACTAGQAVRMKTYFYAIRTTLAGIWIRELGTMPPTELPEMLGITKEDVRDRIRELICIKAGQEESGLHPREALLEEWLTTEIGRNAAVAAALPSASGNTRQLEAFFRKVVKEEI